MYEVSANINAVEVIKLPLNAVFQIDRKSLEPYFLDANLKLIFICSPNNPSGNLIQSEDIEFILDHFNGIVIIDEAYVDFCPEATFATKLNQYPNLIISQTLSKAWGLAGIRLGIALMNEPLLQFYNKVKAPYNISSANQKIALEALSNTTEFELNLKQILIEKAKMIQELQTIKIVKKMYASDANFLLVEVDNANEVYARLIEQKIIIRNRNTVVPNCVRITIGTSEENKKLVSALKILSNG
jgi:histidinol-phosphate aminotransferase